MTRLIHRSMLLLCALVIGAAACDSSSGPVPFRIVTPDGSRVSVLPGESARFEVLLIDASLTAIYLVDGAEAQTGPIFDFTPTESNHTVTLRIESSEPGEAPFTRTFDVVVEVPGNEPPEITSTSFIPATNGEAQRDTFRFTITAVDPDGTVERMTLDFGDGSPIFESNGPNLVAPHVFDQPGTYTLKVRAFDNVDIGVSTEFTVLVVPPNQFPTGAIAVNGVTTGGPVDGDGPFTVRLIPTGNDVDGVITQWELDDDTGSGFRTIAPGEQVEVVYPFREEPYRPVLRLTDDDGDAAEIESQVEIRVFRGIDADLSGATLSGNPLFSSLSIAPAVFADGNDELVIEAEVRDPQASPVNDVPLRLTVLRPALVTPTGRNLGVPASVESGSFDTDVSGRGTGTITTRTSTRVEAIPEVGFVPFDILVEANRGHGEWIEIERLTGANAETTVSGIDGRPFVSPTGNQSGYCPGDLIEIRVEAVVRQGLPGGGGPASGKYTEIRFANFGDPAPVGVTPASGFTNWRTNTSGEIIFNYTPSADDDRKAFIAWVDGQPLDQLGSFNFRSNCP